MYGSEGDDDDCKYHVRWSSTQLCQGGDVYFTVTLTNKSDGKPVTGATPSPDLAIGDVHPGIIEHAKSVEESPGTYKVGPVGFDQSGHWTVRFHFFGDCSDAQESPHGHAAFYVDVP
jgi:hypothetical protein